MNFLQIIGKMFGNKYEKDVKNIMPIVDKINTIFAEFQTITNDQLRKNTQDLKNQISNYTDEDREEIEKLKVLAEKDISPNEKEELYDQIDKKQEEIIKKTEDVLNDVLPTAFAIVKETARRFTVNNNLRVTANEFDRELSLKKDFISLDGDDDVYINKWKAAGTYMQWAMIHYDVQLIGGIVMHQGKIAEMQTGEGKTLSATLPVFLNALTWM